MSINVTTPATITTSTSVHAVSPASCLHYGEADHTACPSSVECVHAHVPEDAAPHSITGAAGRVVRQAVGEERRAADYDLLAAHYGLTPDSTSTELTDAARAVTIMGANASVRTRGLITIDDLTGRDPGANLTGEARVKRDHWKAARTVRAGLVKAVKRATDSTDDAPKVTGTENILTRDGVKRLASMLADGDTDMVMAAVMAELEARTSPADDA